MRRSVGKDLRKPPCLLRLVLTCSYVGSRHFRDVEEAAVAQDAHHDADSGTLLKSRTKMQYTVSTLFVRNWL